MNSTARATATDFIGQTCELLDEERFGEFLEQCSSDFEYVVRTFSPDLGKDMVWLQHDRKGFEMLIKMIPEHVRVDAKLSRHATVTNVTEIEPNKIRTRSKVAVFQTNPNGTSSILAIGTYIDTIDLAQPTSPKLQDRELVLHTQDLGPGVHVPL
ncbi:MAG: hypothetical protein KA735_09245 [Burkholderiaceae bacterium]|nr:hypothetical protein [Burkholderiaceae bacterium]